MSYLAANSSQSFVVELSTYNRPHTNHPDEDEDGCIPCIAKFESPEAILPDTSGYSCAVLGWSISTGESLCFTEPELDDDGLPVPIIQYSKGSSSFRDGDVQHTNHVAETRFLNRKTHNFSTMWRLLTSTHSDMQIMHPTSGGGLEFKNDFSTDDSEYIGVTFSEKFCDRFRLHGAPIIRPRPRTQKTSPHIFEICSYVTRYVQKIEAAGFAECLGTCDDLILEGSTDFTVTFDRPLWPDAVNGVYEY